MLIMVFQAYSELVGSWTSANENRVQMCHVVNKVICYITAANNTDTATNLQEAMDNCDNTAAATYGCELTASFDVSAAPAMADLQPVPLTANNANFPYIDG